MSKGLFKRAIAMSGVPFCDFSTSFEPKRRAFILRKQLGLETTNTEELLEFFEEVPVEKLVDANTFLLTSEQKVHGFQLHHFNPVVEKDLGGNHFITEDFEDILRQGCMNDVDLMIGYTSEEAILALTKIDKEFVEYFNRYQEAVIPRKIAIKSTPSTILDLSDRILERYFNGNPISFDTINQLVQLISHNSFVRDVQKYANLFSKSSYKTYLYKISCISERSIYGKLGSKYAIKDASHLDDQMYLFDTKRHNLKVDKKSFTYKMIQQTCVLFTNFAKFGNPTPNASLGVSWPKYNTAAGDYLDIAEKLTTGKTPDAEVVAFWNSIYEAA